MMTECICGRADYEDEQYRSCYQCFLERRQSYLSCIFCGRWHSPEYAVCFQCRSNKHGLTERIEAAKALRVEILTRDGFTCCDCGSHDCLQIDHIKPCAQGGDASPWNLQVLCWNCNNQKSDLWGGKWKTARIRLMHIYFTFGWQLLDPEDKDKLCDHARMYGREFEWHSNFHGVAVDPAQWAIDLADSQIIDQ